MERHSRLGTLAMLAATLAASTMVSPAVAQAPGASDFPNRQVHLVIPFPPGGGTDILARPLAQKLAERWGQAVVIDNRAGAGGNVGTEQVARAAPDGYTIEIGTVGTHAINQSLYKDSKFDATKDFVAIMIVANTPNILVVNPIVPVKSVADLIALAKKEPGKLNYASPGNGTPPHLAAEIFKTMADVKITHVPYRGTGPALADLLGGQVQLMIANAPAVIPQIKAGKLRALATTSPKRPASLSDIPTLAESGLPGYEADTWYGLFAPAGTPPAIVDKLNADFAWALHQPDIQKLFEDNGAEVIADSPASATKKVASEVVKWRGVIRANNVSID